MSSQEELRKHVAAFQTPDEGHTSALESTLSLDQKVSETEAKQEVFLGFTSKKISKCHKDSENYFALMDYPSIVASVSAAAQSILSCAIVRMD